MEAVATVGEVMAKAVVTCPSTATLTEIGALMRDRDVGDVIVSDGQDLVGIVTDRDIVVRCIADGVDPNETAVSAACTVGVVTVEPGASVDEAARVMREQAVRRLPVVAQGRAVGIVSLGDLAVEADPTSALADITSQAPNH